jgi:hypothetical protein
MKASLFGRGALVVILANLVAASPQSFSAGLTNEWTKPTSGYWEETNYWSRGTLPSMGHEAIVFANEDQNRSKSCFRATRPGSGILQALNWTTTARMTWREPALMEPIFRVHSLWPRFDGRV